MTEDEQRLAIEEAAKIIAGYDEFIDFWIDEAKRILEPMFARIREAEWGRDIARGNADDVYKRLSAKIAALEAERDAARDKAIEAAASLMDSWTNHRREAAAIRALANKDDLA